MNIQSTLTTLIACAVLAYSSAMSANPNLAETSATTCQGCHQEIYDQWKGSMHAQSTALQDPIHGAFYRKVVGDPTQEDVRTKAGKYPSCLKCHVPNAAMEGKTNVSAKPTYAEGINCTVCHTMQQFKGTDAGAGKLNLGTDAYVFSASTLQGTNARVAATHPLPMQENAALLKTNDACMGCHDQRNNANKVPLCMTGQEIADSKQYVTCQSCHMPVVNGKTDHSMLGGHDEAMVQQGIVLSIDAQKAGDTIQADIELFNKLPHRFPSGAPFRNFYLKVEALDANGQVVWINTRSHPMQDDQQAMFMLKLGDAQGKPTAPPTATQILGDTRLKPGEKRILTYKIPAKGAVSVRAEAYYDLLLPPLKKKFGDKLPAELLKSKLAASAMVKV